MSFFRHSDKSQSSVPTRSTISQQALSTANNPGAMSRSPSQGSIPTMKGSAGIGEGEKAERSRRLRLHRAHSDEKNKEKERSDDLTQMMNRASNYMTLAFVKIPSMVFVSQLQRAREAQH